MASRLTVLYGETGVGKSSVLRAGVAHHLRRLAETNLAERGEPGLAVVVFDEWRGDPLPALRRAVADAVTEALGASLRPPEERGSLADAFRMWQQILDGDLYVILDQAEEYFIYHGGEEGGGYLRGRLPRDRRQPRPTGELPPRHPRGRPCQARRLQGPDPGRSGQLPAPGAPRRTGRPRGDRRADLRVQPPRR